MEISVTLKDIVCTNCAI